MYLYLSLGICEILHLLCRVLALGIYNVQYPIVFLPAGDAGLY